MEKILRVKYEQCPALRKAFANSGDIELIKDTGNNKWGKDVNRIGRNELRKLLMKIRGDKQVAIAPRHIMQVHQTK